MDVIPIKPERKAQLEEYAQRRGQDPAAALDDALAEYLEWERQDFEQAVEGIRQGYEDVKAGRTQPIGEAFEELRLKHGLPRYNHCQSKKRPTGGPPEYKLIRLNYIVFKVRI